MFCSLFLSIAFYLLLEGKSKRGSKGRGEITLLVVKRGEEKRVICPTRVYLELTLGLLF